MQWSVTPLKISVRSIPNGNILRDSNSIYTHNNLWNAMHVQFFFSRLHFYRKHASNVTLF